MSSALSRVWIFDEDHIHPHTTLMDLNEEPADAEEMERLIYIEPAEGISRGYCDCG